MNQLEIINKDGKYVVDSRQVAEMVDKQHNNLLRDIQGYAQILENSNLSSQDFFIESTYKTEGNNKTYDCYLITRKGCDMVANKMTGEKGVLFTAEYVTKFEEMEKALKSITIDDMTIEDMIISNANALIAQATSVKDLKLQIAKHDEAIMQHGEILNRLTAKIETSDTNYYTIAGYASLLGININVRIAQELGRRASKLRREWGMEETKTYSTLFGEVNTYHKDILAEIFKEYIN